LFKLGWCIEPFLFCVWLDGILVFVVPVELVLEVLSGTTVLLVSLQPDKLTKRAINSTRYKILFGLFLMSPSRYCFSRGYTAEMNGK